MSAEGGENGHDEGGKEEKNKSVNVYLNILKVKMSTKITLMV